MTEIVLASRSVIRAQILAAAGLPFRIATPSVDEAALKRFAAGEGLSLRETAQRLAEAKALSVEAGPSAAVIGADQILAFEGRGFDKPRTLADARRRLLELQGRAHSLINAVAIARGGSVAFSHLDEPTLFMRTMSEAEIDAYLAAAGEEILASVGAYQVEGLGARLFTKIDGDYFAVLGLALMPVLGYLRREGFLAF